MKAVCWCGRKKIAVEDVPEPHIINPRDAIVRVSLTAICGSDLHLYDGYVPTMHKGDILGHEFMGEVVDVGPAVRNLQVGRRVIVPFCIACGNCGYCRNGLFSCCDNSNPNARMAEAVYGFSCAGMFGYSHMFGGYAGGQAEYVRVPYADIGAFVVPDELSDEQALFLTDIFPTGWQAADNCDIQPGDVVAVWGAGPVGQFAIRSAMLLGASKVIAIDHYPERLRMAAEAGAVPIDFDQEDVFDTLLDLTAGVGPDGCIDAVGLEAHGSSLDAVYDRAKAATYMATDRLHALRQAIHCCRKGGTVSVPGVYGGFLDKMPFGAAFEKGLTFKMGQTHVHRYVPELLERIGAREIDPRFVITHRVTLDEAEEAYDTFSDAKDQCIKVVMRP